MVDKVWKAPPEFVRRPLACRLRGLMRRSFDQVIEGEAVPVFGGAYPLYRLCDLAALVGRSISELQKHAANS
jgi:hypothetical protein